MENKFQNLFRSSLCITVISTLIVLIFFIPTNLTIKLHTIEAQSNTNIYSLNEKGTVLDNLGNYTGAISYYDQALAINPEYINALTNKGIALYRLGNITGAISYYDQALAINPYNTNVLDNKGIALYRLGNITGAISYYDQALAINPNDTNALNYKNITLNNL